MGERAEAELDGDCSVLTEKWLSIHGQSLRILGSRRRAGSEDFLK